MSKGGGGSKTVSTSQTTQPWSAQQPYLQDLFSRSQTQSYAPRVASQSPYTQQAIQQRAGESTDPNSLTNLAGQQYASTIQGNYLPGGSQGNPYLDATVNRALDQTRSAVNANFQGDNFGNSAHQEWMGNKLADTALPYYMGAYESERGRQMGAASQAPGIADAGLGQMQQAGAMQDLYSQRQMDAPWDSLARYQASLAGNYGGQTSGTQPSYGGNDLMNLAGLGMMGYGLYKGF
jgi:hypothetical protein